VVDLRLWLMAARPRTLPAAIAPVLVGTAAAVEATGGELRVGPFLAALAGSVLIQIGTNLANDYSDAKRGADDVDRLGPVRVTAAGLVAPKRVLVATWVAFAAALAVGIYLATVAGPVILAVGAVSIVAGVLYTGGPRPYGYAGLGELFVFLFFGLVAVNGSYFVQVERLDWLPFALSIPVGMLSTAILVVNNVRDIDTDRRAGKMTLAVRLGRPRARRLYAALMLGSFAFLAIGLAVTEGPAWGLLALAALALVPGPLRAVAERTDGPSLNRALAQTGAALAAFSVLLAVGLLIAA
jgi:1,4-dihydroxy-2-naphthoate polyprenyltransferase